MALLSFYWCCDEVSLFAAWGLGWFVPCSLGANHRRLRHTGWEKCGHGLTSRPRESAWEGFGDELLVLFGYPSGSAMALLGGELPLRYCSGKFACRVPTWGLPACGHVRGLVTEFAGVEEEVPWSRPLAHGQLPRLVGGHWVLGGGRVLGGVKRVRLHRKTPAHLTGFGGKGSSQSRTRV